MTRDESMGFAVLFLLLCLLLFWMVPRKAWDPVSITQLVREGNAEPIDLTQEDSLWIAGGSGECVVNPASDRNPFWAVLKYRDSLSTFARRSR